LDLRYSEQDEKFRRELAAWLERYPGHELAGWVGELVHECETRLVRNDLYLAHYYESTRTAAGQRLHAERARALVGERTFRTWVAYLAGASAGFVRGYLGLYQVVASRRDPAVRAAVPTTREAIYVPATRALARAS